jgi:hypothetical protein
MKAVSVPSWRRNTNEISEEELPLEIEESDQA